MRPATASPTPSPRSSSAPSRAGGGHRSPLWPVEYDGAPDAERVVVLMGSGAGAALEAVEAMVADGEKVGVLRIRLYRPFPVDSLWRHCRRPCRRWRCSTGRRSPARRRASRSTLDVVEALATAASYGERTMPIVSVGATALSSKEFTPAMVRTVFDELALDEPKASLHHRHHRRRHLPQPEGRHHVRPDRHRRPARRVLLRTRQRRHGERQQAHREDRGRPPRVGTARATSSTTPRSRGR